MGLDCVRSTLRILCETKGALCVSILKWSNALICVFMVRHLTRYHRPPTFKRAHNCISQAKNRTGSARTKPARTSLRRRPRTASHCRAPFNACHRSCCCDRIRRHSSRLPHYLSPTSSARPFHQRAWPRHRRYRACRSYCRAYQGCLRDCRDLGRSGINERTHGILRVSFKSQHVA